jgi:hypothetical protein
MTIWSAYSHSAQNVGTMKKSVEWGGLWVQTHKENYL